MGVARRAYSPGAQQPLAISERLPGASASHRHSASPESPMGDSPPSEPLHVRAVVRPVLSQFVWVVSHGHITTQGQACEVQTRAGESVRGGGIKNVQVHTKRLRATSNIPLHSLHPKSYFDLKKLLS